VTIRGTARIAKPCERRAVRLHRRSRPVPEKLPPYARIQGDKLPLSFDDAIEFKIEIAHLLVTEAPSGREVRGTIDPWRIKFFPNGGGFSIEVRHPINPVRTLALDTGQTEKFSEQIQKFIDAAGQRT
jgi:hypothetical protein